MPRYAEERAQGCGLGRDGGLVDAVKKSPGDLGGEA